MPVFVVVAKDGASELKERIDALPSDSVYALTGNAWLVSFEGTTRACADKLGIRTGPEAEPVTAVAFSISNYSGKFPTDVWEWLGLHMTRGDT
jgi:hypothetical protein